MLGETFRRNDSTHRRAQYGTTTESELNDRHQRRRPRSRSIRQHRFHVLSGKRSISAKTTEKVMAAVDKLGYTPDASARKMRGMRNQLIALSSPTRGDINKARYNAYFLHTAWAARNAGYDVMLLTGPDATKDIRRVTQSNLVDGVVLLDVEQDDERAAAAMTSPSRAWRLVIRHRMPAAPAWTSISR